MTAPTMETGAASACDRGDLVVFHDVSKAYGSSRALKSTNLTLRRGEILGIVGHNGAGKTTLMRVLVGITPADSGTIMVSGQAMPALYRPSTAHRWGIRIVFQELSLCPTLRVFENAVVGHPALGGVGWRGRCRRLITRQLDRIFPGHGISAGTVISELPLAQRQMVEIAEATIPDGHPLRVLVLDEPTSALGSEPAHQLFEFLREMQRNEQLSVILISHRLPEILGNTDRVAVMRDGLVVGMLTTGEATTNQVLGLMGAVGAEASSQGKQRDHRAATSDGEPIVALHEHTTRALRGISLEIRAGEIVGLAGLEGEGQHELLLTIWRGSRRRLARRGVSVACEVGYVTGDRQNAGVFPLWSVAENVSVNSLRQLAKWGIISGSAERRLVGEWAQRLGVTGSPKRGIGELSGGNQQKTLLARVLASDAKVVLLDDPFRGVDVLTKRQAYAHMREQAREGRAFVWFSTENIELLECDRVEVLRRGQIITELQGEELTTERILAASFAEPATEVQGHGRGD